MQLTPQPILGAFSIERLKATSGERILKTEGAKMLGTGVVIVGIALIIYALRS